MPNKYDNYFDNLKYYVTLRVQYITMINIDIVIIICYVLRIEIIVRKKMIRGYYLDEFVPQIYF